jgi:hypothetical protein
MYPAHEISSGPPSQLPSMVCRTPTSSKALTGNATAHDAEQRRSARCSPPSFLTAMVLAAASKALVLNVVRQSGCILWLAACRRDWVCARAAWAGAAALGASPTPLAPPAAQGPYWATLRAPSPGQQLSSPVHFLRADCAVLF